MMLSLEKGRRPLGGPHAAVLPGLMFSTGLGIGTSEISTLIIGMKRSEHEPSWERSRNVWKPAALLVPALWLSPLSCSFCLPCIFPILPEHLFAELIPPSPAAGVWNTVRKKIFLKNAKLSGCLSSFQISAVSSLPCSYTIQEAYRLPKRALDSVVPSLGPRASATVYGVPWFSFGPKYSPHTLGISGCGGSPKRRNLLWPIRYLDFIKVEERVTSQSNHTHGLWYFNSSLVR